MSHATAFEEAPPSSGVTDHGALTGLGDDDHPQYALADGSRGLFASTAQGAKARDVGRDHPRSVRPARHRTVAVPVSCPRRFPVLIRGRTYYVTCDQPHGHDAPCSGRATDWGAPTL